MAKQFVTALGGGVFGDIKNGGVIVRPDHRGDTLRRVGQRGAGFQIFEVERVLAIAGDVSCVGEQFSITANGHVVDREKRFIFRELIGVQINFFFGIEAAFFARVNRILFTRLGTRIVEILTAFVRYVFIRLFDA